MDQNSKCPQKNKKIHKYSTNNNQDDKKQFKSKDYQKNNDNHRSFNNKNSFKNGKNSDHNDNIVKETYQWDFDELAIHYPALEDFVFMNEIGRTTIDWANPKAHKTLNQAILAVQFQIGYWDMPENQLIPAIPSRLNYLEWISKKLIELKILNNQTKCKGIDIGTGASLIYPVLGVSKYKWNFIATEISDESLQNAQKIQQINQCLKDQVEIRKSLGNIFKDIIKKEDGMQHFTMCNPPFFAEHEEKKIWINTQMKENEYICQGGELDFLKQMFEESKLFNQQISLFTSLVGRQTDFEQFLKFLKLQKEEMKKTNIIQQEKNETQDQISQSSLNEQFTDIKNLQKQQNLQTQVSGIDIYEGVIKQGNTTRWIVGWKYL